MYIHNKKSRRICCVSTEIDNTSFSTDDLEERWRSEYYQNFRKDFLEGKTSSVCQRCIDKESVGQYSDRKMFDELYSQHNLELNIETGNTLGTPIDLDIRESNLCNLKCRMCSPESSSQIEKEFILNKDILNGVFNEPSHKKNLLDDENNFEFLIKNIHNVTRLKLLGGEPTIMPEVHRMLDVLIERDATHIPIFITTNVTNSNPIFIDKISKFSNVYFTFSLDGIGDVVEYIRYPLNWNAVQHNIKVYKDLANSCSLAFTLQAYNLFHIKEFLYWAKENDINPRLEILTSPEWASYRSIPKYIRDEHLQNLLNDQIINTDIIPVIQRCLDDDIEYNISSFVDMTRRVDKIRKHHIKDYIPQVWDIIKNEYENEKRFIK